VAKQEDPPGKGWPNRCAKEEDQVVCLIAPESKPLSLN
jgi:hypothetical protein